MIRHLRNKLYTLLRWSEKYTKTDMVYLTHGGFWLSFNKVVGMATSLALSIAFANLLSKESYGAYKYIISFVGILGVTTLTGMNTALSRSVSLGFEGSLRKVVKIKFLWGLLGMVGGILIASYYFYRGNALLGFGFLVIAILEPLIDSLIVYGAYLQGKKLFKISAILNSITQTTTVGMIIVSLALFKNVPLIILASLGTNFIVQGTLSLYVFKRYPPNSATDIKTISYGKHLSLLNLFTTLADSLDKILLWHLIGPVELAIYSFALAPITQGKAFLQSLTTLAFPKFAQQKPEILRQTLVPKIVRLIAILLVLVIAYMLLAPYLYHILFPAYLDAVPFTRYYALYILLFPLSLVGASFVAQGKHHYLYILRIATPAVKIGLLILLIPMYGIYGAISALLLATIFNSSVALYLFKKPQGTATHT